MSKTLMQFSLWLQVKSVNKASIFLSLPLSQCLNSFLKWLQPQFNVDQTNNKQLQVFKTSLVFVMSSFHEFDSRVEQKTQRQETMMLIIVAYSFFSSSVIGCSSITCQLRSKLFFLICTVIKLILV